MEGLFHWSVHCSIVYSCIQGIVQRTQSNNTIFLQENKDKKMYLNSTCAKFPSVFDLHFNNKYWQEVMYTSTCTYTCTCTHTCTHTSLQVVTTNGTFHLYGAYLDVRTSNRLGPTVRVLGMIDRWAEGGRALAQSARRGSPADRRPFPMQLHH